MQQKWILKNFNKKSFNVKFQNILQDDGNAKWSEMQQKQMLRNFTRKSFNVKFQNILDDGIVRNATKQILRNFTKKTLNEGFQMMAMQNGFTKSTFWLANKFINYE